MEIKVKQTYKKPVACSINLIDSGKVIAQSGHEGFEYEDL